MWTAIVAIGFAIAALGWMLPDAPDGREPGAIEPLPRPDPEEARRAASRRDAKDRSEQSEVQW